MNYSSEFRYVKDFYRFHIRSRFFYCDNFDKNEPLSIIICDNVSIHYNAKLVRMCHDIKILLKYLSSYSSDLNSIEISFSISKTKIKKH